MDDDTITPFGKAFYKRQASYFVIPYSMLVCINIIISSASAAYWSVGAVAIAQILRQFFIHLRYLNLFGASWFRPATVYGLIACGFIIVLTIQSLIIMGWVIGMKWLIIRRRHEGSCPWDQSSYCMYSLLFVALD